jgi:hypothetical protein
MTIEIGTREPAPSFDSGVATKLLVEALKNGETAAPLIRAIVGQAGLPVEQRVLVEALFEMNPVDSTPVAVVEEPSDPSQSSSEAGGSDPPGAADHDRELADLREVNDTVAAALGACPYCWGGDRDCEVCGGHGSPGYCEPDARLFEALIVPAVRRERAAQRLRAPGIRRGTHNPPTHPRL